MTLIMNDYRTKVPSVFLPFCQGGAKKNKRGFRYHNMYEVDTYTKVKALTGAAIGAAAAVGTMAVIQKTKPWNIVYGLKEIVGLAAAAITGGVAVGSIGATNEDKKEKRHEGLFQFLNTALPASFVCLGLHLADKSSKYNNGVVKGAASVLGLLLGMQLASNITNKVTDPHGKVPDRKLTLKDAFANIDDALGVFVLMKPKKAVEEAATVSKKLRIENVLPVIAAWCGYRAGQTN